VHVPANGVSVSKSFKKACDQAEEDGEPLENVHFLSFNLIS